MKILILSMVLVPISLAFSQPNPDTLWTRTYGGSGNDIAFDFCPTMDGGYIVAGYTESFGNGMRDVYLVKVDSLGDTLWTRTYGDSDNDYAYSVKQTSDGGYIVAGDTRFHGIPGYGDCYMIRTNSYGDSIWTLVLGGPHGDGLNFVILAEDEGFLSGGYRHFSASSFDFYLIRTDSNGDTLWTRTYGGTSQDFAYSAIQTEDGGFIVAGDSWPSGSGSMDVYIIKVDEAGELQWSRTYGGEGGELGGRIYQTIDGGYIITATTGSFSSNPLHHASTLVIKVDSQFITEWTRLLWDNINCVCPLSEGGCILTGVTEHWGASGTDLCLLKLNNLGHRQWTRLVGGVGHDGGKDICSTDDGGYMVLGNTNSYGSGGFDIYLIKTGFDYPYCGPQIDVSSHKLNFGFVWLGGQITLPFMIYSVGDSALIIRRVSSGDPAFSVEYNPSDSLLLPGHRLALSLCFFPQIEGDYSDTLWIESNAEELTIILEGETTINSVQHEGIDPHIGDYLLYSAYPNPFNPSTTITFEVPRSGPVELMVYNIEGRLVRSLLNRTLQPGIYNEYFDGTDNHGNPLSSGIYFCRLSAPNFQSVQKMVLLK